MGGAQQHEWLEGRKAPLPFGVTALLVGNLALSFGVLFVRMADVGPVASAFWRMALALPVLFALASRTSAGTSTRTGTRIRPTLGAPRGSLVWLFALSGLFFAADLGAWHIGILQTKLANSNLLANAASFLFPLYGFVLARQKPSTLQGFALVLAALGAALLMGRSFEVSPQYFVGDVLSLTAGVFYTGYLVVIDRVRRDMAPWAVLFWTTLSCTLPLLLFALWRGETVWPHDWMPLLMLALFSQIVGQGLMTYVIGRMSPLLIGIALLLQPAVAAAVGYVRYGEQMGWLDLAGAALIAIALVLVRQPARPVSA
jgi:drug/metabolite transporter (DMT)-like permease